MPKVESSTIFGEYNDNSDRQMADILRWVIKEYSQYVNTKKVALLNHNEPRFWLLLRGFNFGYEELNDKSIVAEYGGDGLTVMEGVDENTRGICLFGTNLVRNDAEKVFGAMQDDRVDYIVLADDERNTLGTGSVPWDMIRSDVPDNWMWVGDGIIEKDNWRAMILVRKEALEHN